MSTEIYLKTGELSSRTLRKAIDEAEEAYKKTENAVDEALMYLSYTVDGNVCYLFPADATNQLLSASSKLKNALNMLNSLKTILDSGPEALAEIDSRKKNDLTNWWQRTTYSVGVGVAAGTAWIKSLFTSGGGKTGGETEVSDNTAYQEIKNSFDWSKTYATDAEIDAVIAAAAVELTGLFPEDNVRRRLKEYYNSQVPIKQYDDDIKKLMDETIAHDLGKDGDKYWDWYYGEDKNRTDSYCAVFTAYHASLAGMDFETPSQDFKDLKSYPPAQLEYFKSKDCFYSDQSTYTPKTGDFVFIDWDGGDYAAHVGMIYVKDDGSIWMLHGNNSQGLVQFQEFTTYHQERTIGFGDAKQLYLMQQNVKNE